MKTKIGKTEIQLAIFAEALERLIKGEGKHVVTGTKLSMAQLAKESGVGSGTIYYKPYYEFRVRAIELMAEYNSGLNVKHAGVVSNKVELQTLRDDRDKEKRLKEEYRDTCSELRTQVKRLCAERGAVEHALYEATIRIAELEQSFEKITGKHLDEYFSGNNDQVVLLPRNLQLIK